MRRLTVLTTALLLGAAGFVTDARAAIVDAPVPTSAYITIGGTDWAWAGPCAPFSPSCAEIDLSYQAGQGWALPTVVEMDMAVAAAGGSLGWADLFVVGGAVACASQWFNNTYDHCDYDDAVSGYIYNLSGGQAPNAAEETFVLRGAVPPPTVPVPAALPLLASGLALVFGVARRRARTV